MSKRHGGTGKRRNLWTVITPGATGPADSDGRSIRIPDRAFTFNDRKRAQRFAGNVQGSKISRTERFWTFKRVFIAAVVVTLVVVLCF